MYDKLLIPFDQTQQIYLTTLNRLSNEYAAVQNLEKKAAKNKLEELLNQAYKEKSLSKNSVEVMILMLAPFAPHPAEELWSLLGHQKSLSSHPWPKFDASMTVDDFVTLSVMVQGKHRGTLSVGKNAKKEEVFKLAKEIPAVAKQLDKKPIKKEIFVPGKVINFVI